MAWDVGVIVIQLEGPDSRPPHLIADQKRLADNLPITSAPYEWEKDRSAWRVHIPITDNNLVIAQAYKDGGCYVYCEFTRPVCPFTGVAYSPEKERTVLPLPSPTKEEVRMEEVIVPVSRKPGRPKKQK